MILLYIYHVQQNIVKKCYGISFFKVLNNYFGSDQVDCISCFKGQENIIFINQGKLNKLSNIKLTANVILIKWNWATDDEVYLPKFRLS